ncbi:MAG: preprotein translocase subunit SecA [Proteobacteria bacterium]|nr:preprotein translocase subunit SecA [Alphaproteobacteria bacterium]NBZ97493.1 preprotein translocase subunit SecA [Candidatus Fonsibacter sp. PEL4]
MIPGLNILKKIFKTSNERKLVEIQPLVQKINSLEPQIQKLSDQDLKSKTQEFKKRIKNGENLNKILPEAFACVREASIRTIGQRHFDVQLLGGIILNQGNISEMKTGEGKTLVATLPAYLNSLTEKGVHVVTVNDYLAKRDSEWMSKIYNFLGVSVGCIINGIDDVSRKAQYECDITYGTNNEFGFDYLRDNMKYSIAEMVQRKHYFCIVDEVDSILIDEARTPLIISGPTEDNSSQYFLCNKLVNQLNKEHYDTDEKDRSALLTEKGIDFIEDKLRKINLLKGASFYDPQNLSIVHHINQSLRANMLFTKDKDYIIKDNQIYIIDEFTGRIMEGRRYSDGLHQAIEAKEGVQIQNENQTLASITFQNYFRLYEKLSGMTGTAMTESEEFYEIYKLDVVELPTNRPMVRKDFNDKIFRTEKEKFNAIIKQIVSANEKKQPVLIGTTSIEKSERISKILKEESIKHNVLNAKFHEQEAHIIAQAGRIGAVTIATNMAGRGTDIQLGGNLDLKIKEGGTNDKVLVAKTKQEHEEEKTKVLDSGGLFVIGTERHESRRIDNQLRGRTGRQGDVGASIFYLSLQDDLMRIFGSEKIDFMLQKLGLKEGESIDHPWINKALEKAQQRVEGRNFDIRKTLLQFDDVMNDQRKVIFEQRLGVIKNQNIYNVVNDIFDEIVENLISEIRNYRDSADVNSKKLIKTKTERLCGTKIDDNDFNVWLSKSSSEQKEFLKNHFDQRRNARITTAGDEINKDVEKRIFLQNLDYEWRSHLQYLEQLRQVIGLRGYGQKNPLDEYKRESFNLFKDLLSKIKENLIMFLINIQVTKEDRPSQPQQPAPQEKISRNASCACGSGKKYKNCCGALSKD